MNVRHRAMARGAGLLFSTVLVTAACASGSTQPTSASTSPAPSPPAQGSSIGPIDENYCAADRQRHERCENMPFSEHDRVRCLEKSCEMRTTFGPEVADALKRCLLQRPCGSHSYDPCYDMVLGSRAQSREAQHQHSRCTAFAQRCGGEIAAGYGKSVPCAYVAQLGSESFGRLNPCFDLACGLGQQCTAGQFTSAFLACDLSR